MDFDLNTVQQIIELVKIGQSGKKEALNIIKGYDYQASPQSEPILNYFRGICEEDDTIKLDCFQNVKSENWASSIFHQQAKYQIEILHSKINNLSIIQQRDSDSQDFLSMIEFLTPSER